MIRIATIEIPNNKRIIISLTYIYGIGNFQSKKILNTVGIDENIKAKDLNSEQIYNLSLYIENNYKIENLFKKEILSNIQRLIDINSYRGIRHSIGLPLRSKTRSNARTHKKLRAKGQSFSINSLKI